MNRRTMLGAAPLLGLGILAACAPPEEIGRATFAGTAPASARGAEIRRAGAALGWAMQETRPGLIRGTLNVRDQVAVVDIPYDEDGFSINYVSSRNLGEGNYIHYNYNRWVRNLRNRIIARRAA